MSYLFILVFYVWVVLTDIVLFVSTLGTVSVLGMGFGVPLLPSMPGTFCRRVFECQPPKAELRLTC